ncbi:unnamed protein product [Kluyveromyces dobzhanskii CBS 2104]|uniref:WGS project CCBQ000000000 data, contig 00011 n=1 Tax=Kluyveromyces dobzhanskii CBS 2104 TaxID=1427455 RepID=A0A0A8L9X0_9SACH|nr:unnamed protein product [Kluyveromyces dobzhanskii CBS 2104]
MGIDESDMERKRRRHSKKGCLTCKVRKKRCSEDRPICKDCARLNLECVFPDNLSKDQIRSYKVWLQTELKKKKLKASAVLAAVSSDGIGSGRITESDAENGSAPVNGDEDPVDIHLRSFMSPGSAGSNLHLSPKLHALSPSMLDMVLTEIGSDGSFPQQMGSLLSPGFAALDKMQAPRDDDDNDDVEDAKQCSTAVVLSNEFSQQTQLQQNDSSPGNSGKSHRIHSPDPYMSQPLSEPLMVELDATGMHLYDYYRDHLAQVICIAPAKQNFYLQCFLPMAHKHRGILYGILAWSAHHLSISKSVPALDEVGSSSRLIMDRDSRFSRLANNYTLESLQCLYEPQVSQDHSSFLYSLAQILVLCGAEICQGDVNRWQILLKTGAKLIKEHIGGSNLISLLTDANSSKFDAIDIMTRNWLLANFIYHDIMGSQTTKFPMNQYETLLLSSSPNFTDWNLQVDSLHGLNRPIFKVLGETTNLIRQMKAEKVNVSSKNFKIFVFDALKLNQQLLNLTPNENGLEILSRCTDDNDNEINYRELSEHLFEIFRLSALIHLKTNVLKVDNNTFEVTFYTKTLLSKLDLVLGTKLESSLCFPMFICGINCLDQDREGIETKFIRYIETYKCRNVVRAHDIMHNVWKMDDEGESVGSSGVRERDWMDICDDIGWDISFA